MAGTGALVLQANITGGPDGSRTFGPVTQVFTAAVNETLPVTLASGNNTITVPAGSTACVVFPPNYTTPGVAVPNPSYGGTLTMKGASGDTGVPMSAKNAWYATWDTAPASIVINASVGSPVVTVWFG